jgi:hypothetical protein
VTQGLFESLEDPELIRACPTRVKALALRV